MLRFSLPCYSSLYLPNNKDLEEADKVILPETVLNMLLQTFPQAMPYPVIFRVSNIEFEKVVHCGVLEFTSPEEAAYLPNWMMDNLYAADGLFLDFTLSTRLPKLTFVKFKPLEYAFTKILDPKSALEVALSKFTALTLQEVIVVKQYGNEYRLVVADIEPKSPEHLAGCVVDTVLTVDFDAPEEKGKEELVQVNFGQTYEGQLEPNEFVHFNIKLTDPSKALHFILKSTIGNPDLYVSMNPNPDPVKCQWSYNTQKSREGLRIEPKDPNFSKNWYYFCVHSYKEKGDYKICVNLAEPKAESELMEKKGGSALGEIDRDAAANDPNFKLCSNCRKFVPVASYTMHSIGCQRNNIWCPECQRVIPKKEFEFHAHCPQCKLVVNKLDLEKHVEFFHGSVACECGIEVPREILDVHKQNECMRRIVSCKFCDTKLPFIEKQEHETICGARSIPCDICNELLPRRKMEIHKAAMHRINPCFNGNNNTNSTSSQNRSNLGLDGNISELGLSKEELEYLRALENSSDDFGIGSNMNVEDSILAQVLSRSAQEAKALGTSSTSSVYEDVSHPVDEEVKEIGDDGSVWNESNSDVEMLETTDCPVCGQPFPTESIEAHFIQEHSGLM